MCNVCKAYIKSSKLNKLSLSSSPGVDANKFKIRNNHKKNSNIVSLFNRRVLKL